MAVLALQDVFTYVDGHDYTCDTNNVKLDMVAAELDVTTFCSAGWKEVIGGVKTTTFTEEGFWQAGSGQLDPEVFPNLGGTKVFTMGPSPTNGTAAYLWRGGEFHYEPFKGSHGDVAGFSLNSVGKDGYGVVRGQLAMVKQTVTATGSQSAVNLGEPAGKYVYASLHAFTAGTSATVLVESDTSAAMASPTTVGTFTLATTAGGSWMTRVAGTTGETFYRFRVSAISGTYSLGGAIGIGT